MTYSPCWCHLVKTKPRRKQEETMQRFNRISCTGRATPQPQLSLSLMSFSLFSTVSLCPSVSMLLDVGVIAGERRMCWSGEWDHWEFLDIQVTLCDWLDRWVLNAFLEMRRILGCRKMCWLGLQCHYCQLFSGCD